MIFKSGGLGGDVVCENGLLETEGKEGWRGEIAAMLGGESMRLKPL